jgi:hypothetical protein
VSANATPFEVVVVEHAGEFEDEPVSDPDAGEEHEYIRGYICSPTFGGRRREEPTCCALRWATPSPKGGALAEGASRGRLGVTERPLAALGVC